MKPTGKAPVPRALRRALAAMDAPKPPRGAPEREPARAGAPARSASLRTVDGKGRVIVPSPLREGMGEDVVVVLGLDDELAVVPKCLWDRMLDRNRRDLKGMLAAACRSQPRRFERLVGHGRRIMVPRAFLAKAGMAKGGDVRLVRVGSVLLIIPEGRWETVLQSMAERTGSLLEGPIGSPIGGPVG